MKLGAVRQHQRDRLAAPESKPREPAGEVVDAGAQFAPADRELVALGADRDVLGTFGGRQAKGLGERARADRGTIAGHEIRGRAIHASLLPLAVRNCSGDPRVRIGPVAPGIIAAA